MYQIFALKLTNNLTLFFYQSKVNYYHQSTSVRYKKDKNQKYGD